LEKRDDRATYRVHGTFIEVRRRSASAGHVEVPGPAAQDTFPLQPNRETWRHCTFTKPPGSPRDWPPGLSTANAIRPRSPGPPLLARAGRGGGDRRQDLAPIWWPCGQATTCFQSPDLVVASIKSNRAAAATLTLKRADVAEGRQRRPGAGAKLQSQVERVGRRQLATQREQLIRATAGDLECRRGSSNARGRH
jgi:hypothetical protein